MKHRAMMFITVMLQCGEASPQKQIKAFPDGKSITDIIQNDMTPGDTLILTPGRYHQEIDIPAGKDGMVIKSQIPGAAILDANDVALKSPPIWEPQVDNNGDTISWYIEKWNGSIVPRHIVSGYTSIFLCEPRSDAFKQLTHKFYHDARAKKIVGWFGRKEADNIGLQQFDPNKHINVYSSRGTGIRIYSKKVTVDGLTLIGFYDKGIYVGDGAAGISILNCNIIGCKTGILLKRRTSGHLVENCEISNFPLYSSIDNTSKKGVFRIYGNKGSDYYADGVGALQCEAVSSIIRKCYINEVLDGIRLPYQDFKNLDTSNVRLFNVVYNNLVHNAHDDGVEVENWGVHTSGKKQPHKFVGAHIYKNVFLNNFVSAAFSPVVSGNVLFDHNLVLHTGTGKGHYGMGKAVFMKFDSREMVAKKRKSSRDIADSIASHEAVDSGWNMISVDEKNAGVVYVHHTNAGIKIVHNTIIGHASHGLLWAPCARFENSVAANNLLLTKKDAQTFNAGIVASDSNAYIQDVGNSYNHISRMSDILTHPSSEGFWSFVINDSAHQKGGILGVNGRDNEFNHVTKGANTESGAVEYEDTWGFESVGPKYSYRDSNGVNLVQYEISAKTRPERPALPNVINPKDVGLVDSPR